MGTLRLGVDDGPNHVPRQDPSPPSNGDSLFTPVLEEQGNVGRLLEDIGEAMRKPIDPKTFVGELLIKLPTGALTNLARAIKSRIETLAADPSRIIPFIDAYKTFVDANGPEHVRAAADALVEAFRSPDPVGVLAEKFDDGALVRGLQDGLRLWNQATPQQRGTATGGAIGTLAGEVLLMAGVSKLLSARFPRKYSPVDGALPPQRVDLSRYDGGPTIDVPSRPVGGQVKPGGALAPSRQGGAAPGTLASRSPTAPTGAVPDTGATGAMILRAGAATPDRAPVTLAPTPPPPVATQIETALGSLSADQKAVVQPWLQRQLAGATSAEAVQAIDALAANVPGLYEAAARDYAERTVVPNLTVENVKVTPVAPDQVDAAAAKAFGINKAGDAAGDGRVALFVGINTPVGLTTALVEGPATSVVALFNGKAAQEVNPELGTPRLVGLPDLDAKVGRTPQAVIDIAVQRAQRASQTSSPTEAGFGFARPGTASNGPSEMPPYPDGFPEGGIAGTNTGISLGGRSGDAPRLLTSVEKAIGSLSVDAFEMNISSSLRRIIGDIKAGSAPIERYDRASGDEQTAAAVGRVLSEGGMGGDAVADAARHVTTIAEGIDVDAVPFASRLVADINRVRQSAASHGPQNPVLVNSELDPASLDSAVNYFSNLLSEAVRVPATTRQVEVDGTTYDVIEDPKIKTPTSINDIDGVKAPSYGVYALQLEVQTRGGTTGQLFIRLAEPLSGTPMAVRGLSLRPGSRSVVVDIDTQSGLRQISVPITPEQARIIAEARNAEPQYVEGLGARYFPAESLSLLQQASSNNARGGEGPRNVVLPKLFLNTFGTMGTTAFRGSPAQLVTSLARSLSFDETREPVPPGLYAAPHVEVYSGGSAITNTAEGLIAQPFGLSPEQAQGLRNVAVELRPLVDDLSRKYGLSPEAREAWQNAIFADTPDIPSIIIPGRVVSELEDRTAETNPGRTFAALQEEIDARLEGLLRRNDLQDIVTLHHTPTGQRPGKPDAVALHSPGTQEAFTTEYQFAVNGQKALPVLDILINDLKANHDIDLKAALEQRGWSYGAIRRLSLEETIAFFADVVRPLIDAHGTDLTGKVIVAADTYGERNDRLGGSDASMIRAIEALYGAQNTYVVQVDTFGGKTPSEPGRNPAFQLGVDPATGRLEVVRPSVDPNGPNGGVAPTAYVTTQEEFGAIFNRALRNQSPLTEEELQVWPGSDDAADVQRRQ